MAKLSRVMARHANTIQDVARRLERVERMLEALLSADQVAAIDAALVSSSEPVEANEEVADVAGNTDATGEGQQGGAPDGDEAHDEPAPSSKPDRRAKQAQ